MTVGVKAPRVVRTINSVGSDQFVLGPRSRVVVGTETSKRNPPARLRHRSVQSVHGPQSVYPPRSEEQLIAVMSKLVGLNLIDPIDGSVLPDSVIGDRSWNREVPRLRVR